MKLITLLKTAKMRRFFTTAVLITIAILMGFSYGYLAHRNQIFPYQHIKKAFLRNLYKNSMDWTIGIYEGSNPFNLSTPRDLENPVLSARDVHDVDAAFIADPFMVEDQGMHFMFFEVMNLDSNTGDIGLAVSDDGKEWRYEKIILDEEFHVSYPAIYKWEGEFYMIPETGENESVRLYKAVSFPDEWEYQGNLLSGAPFYDPTLFYRDNLWWMFTSGVGNGDLNLFYSDSLFSGWQAHPMNPLVENKPDMARPAGHVFEYENSLFRLAQDDYPSYGIQVYAFEITELTTGSYKENSDSMIKMITMSGKGWNAVGMHHVDLHQKDGKWFAVVDGLKQR